MTTIRAADIGRLTIAEAKRLILERSPREKFVDIYKREDGTYKVELPTEPRSIFAAWLDEDFAANCEQLGIVPRWKYRPGRTGYTGDAATDGLYTIRHDELSRLAGLYGLTLEGAIPEQAGGSQPSAEQAPEPDEAPPLEDWKMQVHAEAAAHWLRLRKLHCNPTKHGILPHLAKWCRENNIRTAGPSGIHPSVGYLKNVLIRWEPPR